jgi:uncharacterized protein (DUF111 family)
MSQAADQAQIDCPATSVWELSINLDDVTGEVIGDAMHRLLDAGALDAWTQPITMKKQRPAVMLSLLSTTQNRDALARLTLQLTGGFGLRYQEKQRIVLDRHTEQVATAFGQCAIKVGTQNGEVVTAKPEFDDAQRLADQHDVPVRNVIEAAKAAWHQQRGSNA